MGLVVMLWAAAGTAIANETTFFSQVATDIEGKMVPLSKYAGNVVLVVNTASQCGFTPQYEGLQKLHARFEKKGFVVLGFPSNDFFGQEPGSNQDIKLFCEKNYRVSFPLFAKARVKGPDKQPVYQFLTEGAQQEFRGEVGWNFEKFLIGRQGKIVARFKSRTAPEDPELVQKIEQALAVRKTESVQRK
ncbi:glutathione peroxidase [bacterium]|nr:glutathione peroxidase [bacterium]